VGNPSSGKTGWQIVQNILPQEQCGSSLLAKYPWNQLLVHNIFQYLQHKKVSRVNEKVQKMQSK